MRKIKLLSLFLVSSFILVACSSNEKTGSASNDIKEGEDSRKKYTLTVNNFEPAGAHLDVNVYKVWEELVEEKTNGQVDVDVQHGGVLGPPTTVHTDVAAGLFDVGIVIPNHAYDTKFFPYSIATLPFSAENSRQAAELLTEFTEKVLVNDEFDMKVGVPFTSDGYDLISSKPIDVNKFKGLKMRVSTSAESKFVQEMGGGPVALKVNDAYEALQKGTINISFGAPTMIEAYSMYEVGPYIKRFNFTHTPLIPAMNQDFYDGLTDDLKKLFDEELMPALAEIAIDAYEKVAEETYGRIEEKLKGKGEITLATDEEKYLMKDASKVAWESWIKDANDRGYGGEALVNTYFELLDERNIPRPY